MNLDLFKKWQDLSHKYSSHIFSRKLKELRAINPTEWNELIKDLKTNREIDAKLVSQWLRGETHKCPVCGSETLRTTLCCSKSCQRRYEHTSETIKPARKPRFIAPEGNGAVKFLNIKECNKGIANAYVKAGWRVHLSSDNIRAWETSLNPWDKELPLDIRRISPNEAISFLTEYDVIGADKHLGQIFYGGYYNNKLVSVLSFDLARYSREAQWEMTRICSLGYNPKQLFDAFIKDYTPESIIAYASERYSYPKQYEMLGFRYHHSTEYSYFYMKDGIKYPRHQFMKHKLVAEGFDPSKTESQIMKERGFDKVYDCGNLVYVWRAKKCL